MFISFSFPSCKTLTKGSVSFIPGEIVLGWPLFGFETFVTARLECIFSKRVETVEVSLCVCYWSSFVPFYFSNEFVRRIFKSEKFYLQIILSEKSVTLLICWGRLRITKRLSSRRSIIEIQPSSIFPRIRKSPLSTISVTFTTQPLNKRLRNLWSEGFEVFITFSPSSWACTTMYSPGFET